MLVRFNLDEPVTNFVREYLTEDFLPTTSSEPAIDVVEDENETVIVAELPGVNKEDVNISVENGWLTLSGERKGSVPSDVKKVLHSEIAYQPFSRSIKLPHQVNVSEVSAELINGILKISLPKAEEIRPRSIQIK